MKGKKKLLIATDSFLPRWDGVSRFITELLPFLAKKFSIKVIAPEFEGEYLPPEGVQVARIKTFGLSFGDYTPAKPQVKTIKQKVLESDIVFAQTVGPIGATAVFQAEKMGIPSAFFVHSLDWVLFPKSLPENRLLKSAVHSATKAFVRKVYSRTDLLMVPSREVGENLREIGIKKWFMAFRLGVDTDKFRPPTSKEKAKMKLGLRRDKKLIGYTGRIAREKDLGTLIKAYNIIRSHEPDIQLIIVGKGIRQHDRDISRLGIIRIEMTNRIEDYLQAMDLYVLPSHTETSSLSTMEAMSTGLTVFTTGAGETGKYVIDGKTGFIFERGNHAILAEKIMKVIHDKRRLKLIGREARKIILKHYRWKRLAQAICNALQSLAPRGRG